MDRLCGPGEPLYSLIIPAFNEEDFLPDTLRAVRAAMAATDHPGELIVVDNNSTDRTAAIAREHGALVVFEPVNQISRARNAGARAARGKYLVFTDADTEPSAALLQAALAHLDGGRVCGGGARVAFLGSVPRGARRILEFWNHLARHLRFAAGCFVFCTRAAFDAVGGFSQQVYASEEIWFSIGLGRWGAQRGLAFTVIQTPPVRTSSRKVTWYSRRHLLATMVFHALVPWAILIQPLCRFWYRRPSPVTRPGTPRASVAADRADRPRDTAQPRHADPGARPR